MAQAKKESAKKFLNRTHMIIGYAKEVVSQHKVYTGDLAKACTHQKLARELFKEGKFKGAVYHSHRARVLAFEAIKANKSRPKPEMQLTEAEQEMVKDIPIAAQLDAEVTVQKDYTDVEAASEREDELK